MPKAFQIAVLTLPGVMDPSIAIAAGRAGALGILDLEYAKDQRIALDVIGKLASAAKTDFGVKLNGDTPDLLISLISDLPSHLKTVLLTATRPQDLQAHVHRLHEKNVTVLLEVTCLEQAQIGEGIGIDGLVAKGHEAGGRISDETAFILLQRLLARLHLPVWVQGGIGLHTAAACAAAGAAGVILDTQLALTRESPLNDSVKARIATMDGSETVCLGGQVGETYRIYFRPGDQAVEDLRQTERRLADDTRPQAEILIDWRQAVLKQMGWASAEKNVLLLGADAAFAAFLAERFVTVGGVLQAIREAVQTHCQMARRLRPLDEGAPLACSHGTRYPIAQGPMTRVSDVPEFAARVAEGGALPFLALALLRGPEVKELLAETKDRLGMLPWGVGILGFVPPELREEQLNAIRDYPPPFALIAGGRPDQARTLEQQGIPAYLHVPSPGLLKMFLQQGARRFVFEGRECGGHVGPRTSFVLWNQMIDVLLDALAVDANPERYHVLFAGGVHDSLSAAMVAVMAAPLAEKGVRVGVLIGSAYLFTEEAVASGAILKGFQEQALHCNQTVLLETGPGHSTRCVDTPYAATFVQEKRRLSRSGTPAEEMRLVLEDLNLGRLRIASKGITRHPKFGQESNAPRFLKLRKSEQVAQGMYMIGQVAALRNAILTVKALHHEVAVEGSNRLQALVDKLQPDQLWQIPSVERVEKPSEIAIIGMACLLPKASDLQTYWENILNKVDAITEVPKERWNWELYFDPDPKAKDKVYSKWGGFLDDIPFDPMQYGMPPSSLRSIEPAQLLTLEVVRAALKDAGYLERPFPRERTAVILGAGGGAADLGLGYSTRAFLPVLNALPELRSQSQGVLDHLKGVLPEWTEDSFAGILANVSAGRVANRFDLGGTNCTVDAACASSLAALSLAIKELEGHTSDMAVVGGVDTMQNPFTYLCFSKTHALSPRGRCRTFDESADGISISEGIAIMILKRLADAERDGDRIYAVIKGIGSSSDGKDKGLTAPRPEGQARSLTRAYAKANVSPVTVGLIEAHGTGTVAGDQAEVQALTRVFSQAQAQPQSCAIGSVKSMIGHTKCTAGAASLIKASLALYHKTLPPTLGVQKPNPSARFSETPFFINTESRPWIGGVNGQPRRAGVSAFGFGGTNFHVVMEEYTGDVISSRPLAYQQWPSELFLWKASSRHTLLEAVDLWDKALAHDVKPELRDLAYTAWKHTEEKSLVNGGLQLRLAIIATSLDDLKQKLTWARQALANPQTAWLNDPRGVYFSEQPLAQDGKLAFLFPGQGSQYLNMLRDLAIQFPEVRDLFNLSNQALAEQLDKPLSAYIFPPSSFTPEEERAQQQALTQTNIAQPAIGVASLAMFRVLQALGLQPDLMAGHSYGEYVALAAAGVFSEEALIALSEARGRFVVEAAGEEPGIMAAIEGEAEVVTKSLKDIEGVYLANSNAPRQTVISGSRAAVEQAVKRFDAQGLKTKIIPVACAFHSPIVAQAQARLAEFLAGVELAEPQISVFSNTTAAAYPHEPDAIAARLVEHLIRPVEFVREVKAMYAAGARIFVEVGPRGVLTSLVDQILGDRPRLVVASDQSGRSGLVQLLYLLGQLAAHGVVVKLDRLYQGRSVRRLNLSALERETGQTHPAPTTWLVNGARAKPIKEISNKIMSNAQEKAISTPLRVEASPHTEQMNRLQIPAPTAQVSAPTAAPLASSTTVSASSGNGVSSIKEQSHVASAVSITSANMSDAPAYLGDGVPQVMAQFQHMMARFLDMQKSIMLAYLGGVPGASALESLPDAAMLAGIPHAPGQLQSPQLVVPKVAPVLADNSESLNAKRSPALPSEEVRTPVSVISTAPEAAEVVQAAGPDRAQLTSQLLAIVSERTGYPTEMLDLDLDLEADLGIDSIKRVEILGNFQQSFAGAQLGDAEGLMEKLTGVKTLRGIIEHVMVPTPAQMAPERAMLAEGHKSESAVESVVVPISSGSVQGIQENNRIQRFTLTPVDMPFKGSSGGLVRDRVLLITDDGRGIAQSLADKLLEHGHKVALIRYGQDSNQVLSEGIYSTDLSSPEAVIELISLVRQRQGSLGGIIHLLPLQANVSFDKMAFADWRDRLRLETKSLFYLAKTAGEDLRAVQTAGKACLMIATSMGGAFMSAFPLDARKYFPGQGGLAGLGKTLAQEWPEVRVKAVDLNPQDTIQELTNHLFDELMAEDGQVEVGYNDNRRLILEPRHAPLHQDRLSDLKLDASSVLLITGGARGITAQVACQLAERYQPTLLLVGRSPLPEPEESSETAGVTSLKALKAVLMEKMRSQGQPVTPARVEQAYARLNAEREIRSNLAAMQRLGAKVHYYPIDVRSQEAFGALIDQIYSSFGRLDGVIHGAGLIEDKLLQDKTPESFERVFNTKVDSAFVLSRKLRPDMLKFLVFFSSVSGRFGNRGQGDYAAANEVLNKLAIYLDHEWSGRVVAINWGPWDTTGGMVSTELRKQFAERGVELIPTPVGVRRLEEELNYGQKGDVEVIVGGVGWQRPVEEHLSVSQQDLPLMKRAILSRANGSMEFVRKLDPAYDLYLQDHQLNGNPVLPMVMAMELMAEAVTQGWPEMEVVSIKDLYVLQGVVLQNGAKAVHVIAKPQANAIDGSLNVAVEIKGTDHPQRVHYRATVELAQRLPDPPPVEPLSMTQGRALSLSIPELYQQWLFHGPLFQGITQVDQVGDEGIRAILATSSPQGWIVNASQAQEHWLIDPLMLDSALQLFILWTRERWDMTTLPARFRAYRRFGIPEAGQRVNCEVRIRPNTGGHAIHADIFFFAADGRVLGIWEDAEGSCSKELNRLIGRDSLVSSS